MLQDSPVSAVLHAEVQEFVRQHGLVVWLDKEGHYSDFVDNLAKRRAADDLAFDVAAYRGSFLEVMLALERRAGGLDRPRLLVHLPGFNEDSVRQSPLFEVYAAGRRFRKKLKTLVTEAAAGKLRPADIDGILTGEIEGLAGADVVVDRMMRRSDGGISELLDALSLPALFEDLRGGGAVAEAVSEESAMQALWAHLEIRTGLTEAWREAAGEIKRVRDVAFVLASWALCCEFVHDLTRPPLEPRLLPLTSLPRALVDACNMLCGHLRERHPEFYMRTAEEVQARLPKEWPTDPSALGSVDTFPFEEARILEAALDALGDNRWADACRFADDRIDGGSIWLSDPNRRSAWDLVRDAARLGLAIEAHAPDLGGARVLDEAVGHYVESGAVVDRAHRKLEQRRAELLFPTIPSFAVVRDRLDHVRRIYRAWADALSRAFSEVCELAGFIGDSSLQQRSLFDEVVRPLTKGTGTTALFMVDALRFEMAQSLFDVFDEENATQARLHGRLAELPTITAVGMNALAPVADRGRLRPVLKGKSIDGFSTSEFRVTTPDHRRRAMQDRVGGATCPLLELKDVLARDIESLRRGIAQASLVVVHSLEADLAGEKGIGFSEFERVLQQLRGAWKLLRDAGVKKFVFTADHGFLLIDSTTRDTIAHGKKADASRRHAIYPEAQTGADRISVPMTDLGYEGVEGQHLVFSRDTRTFDKGKSDATFVHGGNSPQERIIPVLTVIHKHAAGGEATRYVVTAQRDEAVGGMHRIRARIENDGQGGLAFGGAKTVDLALRPVGDDTTSVELCHVTGGGELFSGSIRAKVGASFELFFRLSGPADARAQLEVFHPTERHQVASARVGGWFAVAADRGVKTPKVAAVVSGRDWLEQLPAGGVRALFDHLLQHGAVSESEAVTMFGNARKLRRFSLRLEEHAAHAPFGVRVESISGTKRYVREDH